MTLPRFDRPSSLRTRRLHHTVAERFEVVIDTHGVPPEDIFVAIGSRTITVEFDVDSYQDRCIRPPASSLRFGDEREATYRNGILTISTRLIPG